MYLKSLTLKGFKSFADRTSMTFDPGLTVVVGPNGSGKSNVSDAILWVLGEQSAKMLRGNAMEDVIFAGSSSKRAVGVAEVTLVLDNTDHTLPVDFADVSVSRRMYRSGESEYLINGAPARLRDVQDILHDSGLGKDTHSIISQGKLDSVLSSRPEDRRALVEEAADISKHRRRKERSERKLAAMDANLAKAKVVAREIRRQLKPLERQVDKARRARELQESLDALTQVLAVDDLRRLQEEHARITARGREAEAAVELARYRMDDESAKLERLQSMLEQKGLFVGDLGEQRRRMQDVLSRMDAEMRLLEEKGKNMVARLSETRMSLSSMRTERAAAARDLERVDGELSDAGVRLDGLTAEAATLEAEATRAGEARSVADAEFSRLAADERAARAEADRETLAYAKLEDRLKNAEVQDGMYASRLEQLAEQLASAESALAAGRERRDSLARGREAAEGEADEAARAIADAQRALVDAREDERDARERLALAEGRLAALTAAARELEEASPLAASLADDAEALVSCRLADAFEAPEELEPLLERLLGEDLGALVVPTAEGALELAERAGRAGATGTATVVRADVRAPEASSDALPGEPLVGMLEVAAPYEGLVGRLLGDVRVVDAAREALAADAPGRTFLCRDGVVVLPDGRLCLGGAEGGERGALERKRRIRALEAGMGELGEAAGVASEAVANAEAVLAAANDRSAEAKAEAARLAGELRSADAEIGRLESQARGATAERDRLTAARTASQAEADEARRHVGEHRAAAAEAAERADALAEGLDDATTRRDAALADEQAATGKLSDARLSLAMARERRANLARRERDLTRRVADLERRIAATEQAARSLEVVRLRVDPLYEAMDALHERALEWAERLRDRASLAEADSDSLKRTIGDAREAVSAASEELERAKAREADVRVDAGRLEAQVEAAVERIRETGAVLEEALALPAPEDRAAAERRVERLREELAAVGPVNAVAMEEYERLRARSDYVAEQVADLERARASLRKITAAVERKMRTRFLATFDAVNANFGQIFAMLFPGGAAHLEMTDPDDPSQTGIEVVAQPLGKRLVKMSLMSGGEKSLTALALLFAVYKTRTVPFYVFDEVEAALDDSNLSRFLDAVERLKETTQLIVISHQRRTMEQADVLYGVSMRSDGVSRVVSQRLDRTTGKVVDA